jgi:hypothetical protein
MAELMELPIERMEGRVMTANKTLGIVGQTSGQYLIAFVTLSHC